MQLIINADDFGLSHSVNFAIAECFDNKIINQTTIMVNMPFFEQAVELSKEKGFKNKVGIHINLDSGIPLTDKIKNNTSFCNSNGCFHGMFFKNKKNTFFINKYDKESINEEVEAQFIKYIENGFTLLHFDSHHHIHNHYSFLNIITSIAKKYGFLSTRLCRNMYIGKPIIAKKVYKYIVNKKIQSSFKTSEYFGSYSDYMFNKNKRDVNDIEIMLHPDIVEGKLVDVINKNTIKEIEKYEQLLIKKERK